MQVQSLMTRAEELAFLVKVRKEALLYPFLVNQPLTLQVVQAIRTELSHVQAEAEACKKNHQNVIQSSYPDVCGLSMWMLFYSRIHSTHVSNGWNLG